MLQVTQHRFANATLFNCAGEIAAETRAIFERAILPNVGGELVILDMAGVTLLDAAGLGLLMALHARAEAAGARLKLMNVTPAAGRLLELANLNAVLERCSAREIIDLLCWISSPWHDRQPQPALAGEARH